MKRKIELQLFICEVLINNLEKNIEKIEDSIDNINEKNYEAFYIYNYSLFESAICEVLRHLFNGFPMMLPDSKEVKIKFSDIYNNLFKGNYMLKQVVNEEIRSISKGNARSIIEKLEKMCKMELEYNIAKVDEISTNRNAITHENTESKQEYISGNFNYEQKKITVLIVKEDSKYLKNILLELKKKLNNKYRKYTKYKLIKSLWGDIFDSPLLNFEDCIFLRKGLFSERIVVGLNFTHIKQVAKDLSSSEKFFLSILLQQYSGSANGQVFKFEDIPSLASIMRKDVVNEILLVFDIYPNLFNGTNIDGGEKIG